MTNSTLVQRDEKVIWHPFTQHGLNLPVLPVTAGEGAYLILEDGRKILDGISSWWVNLHGHGNSEIAQAIQNQATRLEHVMFARFTHAPAVEYAELLTSHSALQGAGLSRVFYSDNGSTAVEAALKIAFQYFWNQGNIQRTRFLALHDSYHGDTLGAMAVGEPDGFHSQFRKLMPEVDFVQIGNLEQLKDLLEKRGHSYAAFIFEPLVQGAGGMKIYSSEFLESAVRLCQSYGILTIADEIFTGYFRTGKCFAFEYTNIQPDLLCLSKGITGGFLPLAVTLASNRIFEAFISKEIKHAFLHGHSYTANPIACAAAIASWKLLHSEESQSRISRIVKRTQAHIDRLRQHPRVKSARCLGTIGAVEMENQMSYFSSNSGSLMTTALEKGVLIRPLGDVLYSVPPYCVTEEEVDRIYGVMEGLLG
jgi:adenosylmethionine---8-amino-7-oxononanoate aminotransferase